MMARARSRACAKSKTPSNESREGRTVTRQEMTKPTSRGSFHNQSAPRHPLGKGASRFASQLSSVARQRKSQLVGMIVNVPC